MVGGLAKGYSDVDARYKELLDKEPSARTKPTIVTTENEYDHYLRGIEALMGSFMNDH